ncbi:uncharacterized protein F4817DRAFT_367869 [Daldinia loculata]|uniref:uncharacterized protein n=1 Tax=Daldinia loculata TaxID=103429 RepID=UPI0020C57EE9|nr:uncharacterized protein F4817DRAFT_367869 [Daldinia loculata]KAI1644143.1 hypothetical protein F4817DRAFT_367869 [Daldinia loculata]
MSNHHHPSPTKQLWLPISLEEVTASWLTQILGHKVKAVEHTSSILKANAGKLFITLTCDDDVDSMKSNEKNPKTDRPNKLCIKGRAVLEKYFTSRNPKFQCLVHGDAHIGNTFLIKGEPRFLDWQAVHISSAFHDVSYFIASSLTVEDRREHEMRILNHYLDELNIYGGASLSSQDEDLMVEYRKSMLAGLVWLLTPYELQKEERIRAMIERQATALIDHRVIELIESLPDAE